VGDVLKALDEHKLAGKTLVIFTGDNGHAKYTGLPALQQAGHDPSGPFRGYKADIFEGGHRVPFVVRWPGHVKAGSSCAETICHTNLLATSAAMLGQKIPDNAGEDSFSILPLLQEKKLDRPAFEAVVHQSAGGMLAIRHGKWKLILGRGEGSSAKQTKNDDDGPPVQLYDLAGDLGETKNVAADHPEIVKRLTDLLQKYIDDGRSTPGPAQKNDVSVPIVRSPKK
jgi:arylsulfatase A-like enzyme